MNVIFWTGVFDLKINYRAIGPYQLAWWLRQNDFSCQVIDFVHHMTAEDLVKITKKFVTSDTICIGVSSTFWSELNPKNNLTPMSRYKAITVPDNIRQAIKEIRDQYPKLKIVLGGHSADFIETEDYQLFDMSLTGDAEDSFLEILQSWKKSRSIFHSVYRGNKPFVNAAPNLNFKIEHLRHKFLEQDCIISGETLPIEISRGCIFKCAFCQYPHIGKTKFDYLRQFEYIQEELEYNYRTFNTTNYYILDDTFNDSDYKVKGWYDITQKLNFKLNFTAYLRADLLHRNIGHAELLRDSGLMSGFFGIESFHPEASRSMGKGWSGKQGREFLLELLDLWKNDVTFHTSFIVGLPPEKIQDYYSTLDFLMENNFHSWVFKSLLITPGFRLMNSDLDRNPEKYGFTYNETTREWRTKFMSRQVADMLSKSLNSQGRNKMKITSWKALSLMNTGLTKHELNNTLASTLDWSNITANQQNFIDSYKQKLISL
jgi:radical SAM superfamily enzyme YgiQ (UPF0313 family)